MPWYNFKFNHIKSDVGCSSYGIFIKVGQWAFSTYYTISKGEKELCFSKYSLLFWGIYSASRKYWQCLACSTFSHVYITIFYSWHKSWKKNLLHLWYRCGFFYVIRYGRKFLGIMHRLHSAAKQSTVQCSNLFMAAPKRKQKMRKKACWQCFR